MTIGVKLVDPRDYQLKHILDGEIDVVEEMLDKSGYLCDAVSETADSNIPIYNAEIWENVHKISDYVEDAISEGIAPVEGSNVDLIKIFQSGYYVFYQELLYENLDTIAYNYIVEKVNEYLNSLQDADYLDISEIEEAIEEASDNTDNNDTFDDLSDKADEIINRIKDGEFGEREEE